MSPRARLVQRILPLAVLGTALVAVPVMVLAPTGLARLRTLRAERDRADQEVSRLTADIQALRAEAQRAKNDPRAIERAARDGLGLLRKTEVVFVFGP